MANRMYDQPGWEALRKKALAFYGPYCHLCKERIDLGAEPKSSRSYSLDHLDPVVHHGPDLPDLTRVRPAHYGCNSSRKATPMPPNPASRDW